MTIERDINKRWEQGIPHHPKSEKLFKRLEEIDWEYLVEQLPKHSKQIAFGANFHPYLSANPSLFDVSLYEPESMSKFLDLEDMKLYPSSFNLVSQENA